jgi:peptidyl-prolyl cis-trans isomerase C
MKSIRNSLLAAVALSALLAACGDEKGTGNVVATVNGEAIYESQINEQLSQIPANLLEGREADIRRQITENLVQKTLLSQEAEKLNVEKDPSFTAVLNNAREQLEANFVIQNKVNAALTDETLRNVYETQKDRLAFPAVKAKHILVSTEAEAQNLIRIANPDNFSDLARQSSTGPSKDQGGDLGWFRREAMIPEFASVAFSTPKGTVAQQPVKTQFGWHVILVEDRNDAYVPPFEAVAEQLRQQLAQEVVQGSLQEMRAAAKVEYKDASLAPQGAESSAQPAAGEAAPAPAAQ